MENSPHSLLISDLHLCDARPDLNQAFVQFCEQHANKAQALYILGDLSDAWTGDDDDGETAELIRKQLKDCVSAGTAVYLMTGNRDFLMGKQLAEDTGLTLLNDPTVVELHGQRSLLMHGDSLCTDDAEYMAFRAQIRNPQAQAMLLSKSLEERRGIAQMLRAQSKSANSNKAEDIMDVNQDAVLSVLKEHSVDLLIHGHTHRPDVHKNQSDETAFTRMVLGDWNENAWYIRADENGQQLESYAI